MSETPVVSVQAVVLYYNSQKQSWVPAGQGTSVVELYRHTSANTYRVVARCLFDQSVVINSPLYPNLEYRRATETFHQWQDSRYVYGLNFPNQADAVLFGTGMENAIRAVNASTGQATPPPPPAEPTPPKTENRKSNVPPAASLPLIPNAAPPSAPPPAMPPAKAPTNPNFKTLPHKPASGGPPPPPAPPAAEPPTGGAGGPPPPPPPPPAGAGGSLADQIAAAKLKKRETIGDESPPPPALASAAPASNRTSSGGSFGSGGSGGGGGGDMMSEMAAKMAAKRKAAEAAAAAPPPPPAAPAAAGDDQEDLPPPPPPGGPGADKPAPASKPIPAGVKASPPPSQKFSNGVSSAQSSPQPAASTPVVAPRKSASQTNLKDEDLVTLKNEILAEFRLELDKFKQEILAAIKQH